DSTGVYEAMIFSEVLSASRDIIQVGNTVLAEVDVQIQGEDDIRFLAQRFEPLDKAVDFATKSLTLTISAADNLAEIKNILDNCGYGKVKVSVELEAKARHVEIALPASYALTGDEISVIRKLEGVEDVVAA
ncbi:MAG: hypothetical protein ACQEQL_06900, partial [Pseudomonadota bacterium]